MKRLVPLLLALALLLTAGCSSKPAAKAFDDGAAATLLASGAFAETLTELDSEVGLALYGIDPADVTEADFYLSSGAVADELAYFTAKDSAAADRVEAAASQRVEAQKNGFKNYVPAEMPKLEDAVVHRSGLSVLLCVPADSDKADGVLKDYIK